MDPSGVYDLLMLTAGLVGLELAFFGWLLWRKGLFRWTTAGFWAWSSFALYYALNPVIVLISDDIHLYQFNLSISGGTDRGLWILAVTLLGMGVFFWAYLRTSPGVVTWRLRSDAFTLPMFGCASLFVSFGAYSLLTQRAMMVDPGREKIIEAGRFTGQVSGYENAGYMFLVVPILMLLYSRSLLLRILGWLTSGFFVLFTLPSGWSRFAIVAVLISVSLADTVRRRATWPRWFLFPVLLVFTAALQLRGHYEWEMETGGIELLNLSRQVMQNMGESVRNTLGSREVSPLANWYLTSYIADTDESYTLGLPAINYALTGWIPYRLFPEKYFLVDWLDAQRSYHAASFDRYLYGTKSSLLGSFYSQGGLLAVLLLSSATGFMSRKLDGMLKPQSPLLVRATGTAWVSVLWMIWLSSETWAVMALGTLGLPALALWILAPKVRRNNHD